MSLRALLFLTALAVPLAGCTVHVVEPGAVLADGSVYLGWNLFSGKGKTDREDFPVGQQQGGFSSLRLHTDKAVALPKATVIFADGERYALPVPRKLAAGGWTNPIALPNGPRAIHSIVVDARSSGNQLAKIEIYAKR